MRILVLLACSFVLIFHASARTLRADLVIVDKSERRLTLLWQGKPVKNYKISLGFSPEGPKRQEGDGKTPEGNYIIDSRNPHSSFHLSLHISYPNAEDSTQAKKNGVKPGGDIFIHGLPNSIADDAAMAFAGDWTLGCIAVNNSEIKEIWDAVPNGTPIQIQP